MTGSKRTGDRSLSTVVSMTLTTALLISSPQAAIPAAAETFFAGEAVTSVISQLEASLSQIIRELEGAYSRSAFDTRTHAIALLQQLQLSSEALAGKTFGGLDTTQQAIFTNVRSSIDEWNRGNKKALDSLDDTVVQLDSVLATLPLAKTWPRVLRYSPSFVIPVEGETTFNVDVFGSWLGEGNPTLSFQGGKCERLTKTESSLKFTCKIKSLATAPKGGRPVSYAGALTVESRADGMFDWFKGAIGFAKTRSYDIGVAVLPRKLGELSGTATVVHTAEQTQTRNESCSHHNNHCQGAYGLTCNMTVTAGGWQIEQNSVAVKVAYQGAASHFDGVFDKTTSGFQVRATVANSGACGPGAFGMHAGVDARGAIGLDTSWTERRTVEQPEQVKLQPVTVNWDQQASITLPDGTKSVTLALNRADGGTDVLSGTGTVGWIAAEFRPEDRTFIVRPLAPSEALGR